MLRSSCCFRGLRRNRVKFGRMTSVQQRYNQDASITTAASSQVDSGTVLWTPSTTRVSSSRIVAFSRVASEISGRDLSRWSDLHAWSISETGAFWQTVSDFCGMKWIDRGEGPAYAPPPERGQMTQARWFEGATLNYADNALPPPTDKEVLVSVSESPRLKPRRLTGKELHDSVARCSKALRAAGVTKGDRVAGVMTNSQEAIVCLLATASIGAIWSSCSPDFGVGGAIDRLGQVTPKVVFFSLGYLYGGRWHDCRNLAAEVLAQLPGSPKGVGVPYWPHAGEGGYDPDPLPPSEVPSSLTPFDEFLGGNGGVLEDGKPRVEEEMVIHFEPTPFDHPVFIMFSSGTTGLPKCMVHGAGGTLIHQKKELELHCDLRQGDRLMYFSTLGWMMWNWSAATLAVDGTTLVTFDGSPGYPDLGALWKVAARERLSHLGASPKYFGACRQKDVVPSLECESEGGLGSLRAVLSTGSPLLPEHFQWVYESVKSDVHLASISGGTDILGCFALGNPALPVRAGHIQCLGLGMDICAYRLGHGASGGSAGGDGDEGGKKEALSSSRKASSGEMGELVCRNPFPSMPVFFWGDESGAKYRSAYFETFPGEEVWAHGDFVKVTEDGGVIITGRSDAVLNPAGVRIGTAEIYRQVEEVPEVADSIAVGLQVEGDVKVVLFVKVAASSPPSPSSSTVASALGPEAQRDEEQLFKVPQDVEQKIRLIIRSNLTARHVPSSIMAVDDIPYTRSGKKVELAVTKAIHGQEIENISALANPDSLQQYRDAGHVLRGVTSPSR